jgi:Sigma-70, region 4
VSACSNCGETGHNARTCAGAAGESEEAAPISHPGFCRCDSCKAVKAQKKAKRAQRAGTVTVSLAPPAAPVGATSSATDEFRGRVTRLEAESDAWQRRAGELEVALEESEEARLALRDLMASEGGRADASAARLGTSAAWSRAWHAAARMLFARCASLRAMNDRLRAGAPPLVPTDGGEITERFDRLLEELRGPAQSDAPCAPDASARPPLGLEPVTAARAPLGADMDVFFEGVPVAPTDLEQALRAPPPPRAVTRDVERSRRKRDVRSLTINVGRLPLSEIARERAELPDADRRRLPMLRGECGNERPCPYVSCKHHLFLEASGENGSIKLNFPDLLDGVRLEEMPATCVLDVADQGGVPLERVGELMNVTRERIRQLEEGAKEKVRGSGAAPMLADLVDATPRAVWALTARNELRALEADVAEEGNEHVAAAESTEQASIVPSEVDADTSARAVVGGCSRCGESGHNVRTCGNLIRPLQRGEEQSGAVLEPHTAPPAAPTFVPSGFVIVSGGDMPYLAGRWPSGRAQWADDRAHAKPFTSADEATAYVDEHWPTLRAETPDLHVESLVPPVPQAAPAPIVEAPVVRREPAAKPSPRSVSAPSRASRRAPAPSAKAEPTSAPTSLVALPIAEVRSPLDVFHCDVLHVKLTAGGCRDRQAKAGVETKERTAAAQQARQDRNTCAPCRACPIGKQVVAQLVSAAKSAGRSAA